MKERGKGTVAFGRVFLTFCLFAVLITLLAGCSGETNPYIQSLDIQIGLNADGSADVTETHVVNFGGRGKEWWNYFKKIGLTDRNSGNAGKTVSEMSGFTAKVDGADFPHENTGVNLDNASSSKINSMRGTSYTYGDGSYVEIGVVTDGFSEGVRTIEFRYSLSDLMLSYADCAGFYYKFVDESNTMYVEKLTATVRFNDTAREDIAVWTHIEDGNGQGVMPDGDTVNRVEYLAEGLADGVYFETRLLLPSEGYTSQKTNPADRASIIAEETAWQEEFYREARRAKAIAISDIVVACALAAGCTALCFFIRKKRKPKKLADAPEYFREIPEGWTAGEMAPLYHYYGKYEVSDAISATILDLCRRHYIDIKVGERKKEAEITVRKMDVSALPPHEKIVYELLAQTGGGQPFTMKQMEKYASKNYDYYSSKIEAFEKASYGMSRGMGLYPNKGKDRTALLFGKVAGCMLFAGIILLLNTFVFGFFGLRMPLTGFILVAAGIVIEAVIKRQKSPLPENGQRVYDKFHALGRFMLEFGNMKEHELPQLVLWEEYMVYATAMGIADKVAEQLEIAYPQYREMVRGGYSSGADTFLILYLLSPSVRIASNFALAATIGGISRNVATLTKNAKIAANVKKFSSSGGHGGFGGGGGFRGGGGGFGGGGMGAR